MMILCHNHTHEYLKELDEIMVEDLGSTNGTYLNKQKVTAPTVMKIGDWLQLGDTIMELK